MKRPTREFDRGWTAGFRCARGPLEKQITRMKDEIAFHQVQTEFARGDGRLDVLEAFVEVLERATDGKRRP